MRATHSLRWRLSWLVLMLGAIMAGRPIATAGQEALDIYVVYDASTRDVRRELTDLLEANHSVRGYNADLLGVADYAGKQKALARLERARVVIILGDRVGDLLGESTLQRPVVVAGALAPALTSDRFAVRIVDAPPAETIAGQVHVLTSMGDVPTAEALRQSAVLVADPAQLPLSATVVRIVEALLQG